MQARSDEVKLLHMKDFRPPTLEYDGEEPYPEQRLWTAVLLATLTEYEMTLKRIKEAWRMTGRPVSRNFLMELYSIRHECRHEWFRHICEMANWPPERILGKFNEFDKQYELSSVKFSATDNAVTRYQIRKIKDAKRLRKA